MNIKEFAKRRQQLIEKMGEGSIAILASSNMKTRNRDVDYPFRQDSDFYYLSNFNEPEAVLALIPGREHGESILCCRERDPEKEMWDGKIVGPEGAIVGGAVPDVLGVALVDRPLCLRGEADAGPSGPPAVAVGAALWEVDDELIHHDVRCTL